MILEIQNIDVSMALTAAGYGCSFTRDIHAVELQAYQPAPQCFSVGRQRTLTQYAAAYRKARTCQIMPGISLSWCENS